MGNKLCDCNNFLQNQKKHETNVLSSNTKDNITLVDKINLLSSKERLEIINKINKISHAYRNHLTLKTEASTQRTFTKQNNETISNDNSSISKINIKKNNNKFPKIKIIKSNLGIQIYENGIKYIGTFENKIPKGIGILYDKKGDIYRGEFLNKLNGYGEHKNEKRINIGYFKNNIQNGIGYEKWKDGTIYKGNYLNGNKNGIGSYFWNDGTIYEGEWENNTINGFGIYKFIDGRIYNGQWKNNLMHGYGEFFWVDGKKYFGYYYDDKKSGFGIYFWPKDKFYIGFWEDGFQNGIGKSIKGNNIKFGIWKNGKKNICFNNENEFELFNESRKEEYKKFFHMNIQEIKNFFCIDD